MELKAEQKAFDTIKLDSIFGCFEAQGLLVVEILCLLQRMHFLRVVVLFGGRNERFLNIALACFPNTF